MSWLAVLTLAAASLAALTAGYGLPWKSAGIALLLGLGGYALQGHPDVLSAPHRSSAAQYTGGPALLAARLQLNEGRPPTERWMVVADAMARHGQFGEAASVLLGSVNTDPGNAMAWLALGDALYAHSGGRLTQAATLAYDRADAAAAKVAPAPVLVGTALEQSGRLRLAAFWWQRRLSLAPKAAPWRGELEWRHSLAVASLANPRRERMAK